MTPAVDKETTVELAREVTPPRRTLRGRWWIAATVVCAVALAGGALAAATALTAPEQADQPQVPISTAKIELGTLAGSRTVTGVLDFTDGRDLQAGAGGTVTHLPDAGSQISQGGELYRIDNVPTFLFHGQLPAWRSFEQGMDDGPDVQQLEAALQALGFFVDEPDQRFEWGTVEAIYAWQRQRGKSRPDTSTSEESCSPRRTSGWAKSRSPSATRPARGWRCIMPRVSTNRSKRT